jgi:hypothetical protein
MKSVQRLFFLSLIGWFASTLPASLQGQLPEKQPSVGRLPTIAEETSQKPTNEPPTTVDALRSLMESMSGLRAQWEKENQLSKTGQTDAIKEESKAAAAALQLRLSSLQADFDTIASGISSEELKPKTPEVFDLKSQFDQLIQPLIQEINAATEQPRTIEKLRGDLSQLQRQENLLKDAVSRLETIRKELPKAKDGTADAQLRRALDQTHDRWKRSLDEANGRAKAVSYQLSEQLSRRKSIWDLLTHTASTFFVARGLHLLMAMVAMVLAFFGWRAMHRWFTRLSPWHRIVPKPFMARLVDVIYHSLALVIAIIVFVIVLYSTGDWLMLGLTIIALLALLLAAKTVAPKYYQQARFLLNLGDVREGECVIINGLRWEVKSLNMYCQLYNPAMNPHSLRVPITHIIQLSSRAFTANEPWFPCKEGDWMLSADGRVSKAVCISPDLIQLVEAGGSRRTIPTSQFLTQGYVNLSGGFRLSSILKLSAIHLNEATKQIPETLSNSVKSSLLAVLGKDGVRDLNVELKSTALSCLEYEITGDFDGSLADHYAALPRTLHRLSIDTCNAHGWQIAAAPAGVQPAGS